MASESPAKKAVKRKVTKIDSLIDERFIWNLETYHIPNIINVILQDYDVDLAGRVIERRSRTNPIFYRDEFEEALINFKWIDTGQGYTTLVTPETETFDWRQGRLTIIERMLVGLSGLYIEVDEEEYIAMYEKRPIIQPFDKAVPRKERIYPLRLTGAVRRIWAETFPKKDWVRYPFSNTGQIDIFDSANMYVKENFKDWMAETNKEVLREVR